MFMSHPTGIYWVAEIPKGKLLWEIKWSNLHRKNSVGIMEGGAAKTVLKNESLQRWRIDAVEILCWHRTPLGFGKGIQVCASLWEEAFGMELPAQHRSQSPWNSHKEGSGGHAWWRRGWMIASPKLESCCGAHPLDIVITPRAASAPASLDA